MCHAEVPVPFILDMIYLCDFKSKKRTPGQIFLVIVITKVFQDKNAISKNDYHVWLRYYIVTELQHVTSLFR